MFSPKMKLKTPENFDFPFEPYKIQSDLMKSLYSILENKQIGIFESPTGTGKSLTLASSSIKWLFDYINLINGEIKEEIESINDEIKSLEDTVHEDWIQMQSNALEKKTKVGNLIKINRSMIEYSEKIQEIRQKSKFQEKVNFSINNIKDETKTYSNEHLDDSDNDSDIIEEKQCIPSNIKIFFCSRTHSQLSQVVKEIKRTNYGKEVRCISLASRQNLCINEDVRKLNSVHLINEKCLEMQKNSTRKLKKTEESPSQKKARTSKISKCQFKSKHLMDNLKNLAISEILDIEDLVLEGKKIKSCPYYSSRLAIKDAQVIMLPYQMLFHRSTRIQSGICLKNNIVIIDEAHNLLDTISNIYSAELELHHLDAALNQLTMYKEKYFDRFSTKTLLKINQIIFVVKRLSKIMRQESKTNSKMIKTHELMSEGEFYNIDIFGILEFCENTHFAEKVHSFAQKCVKDENFKGSKVIVHTDNKFHGIKGLLKKLETEKNSSNNNAEKTLESNQIENKSLTSGYNVIRPLLTFLDCLTECADDGGVIIKYKSDENYNNPAIKFVLLNPERHFKDIIEDCRSIIIAGGTMQPINDLTDQLFKSCIDRVKVHVYGHVVSQESILPIAVTIGSSGKKLNFNFQNRNNPDQLRELGQTMLNICNVIPAGIVCFVPSYDYLDSLWTYLNVNKYLERIEKKKFIFRETKSNTNHLEEKLLTQYSNSIKNKSRNGALLFSVVGGKLSEGLNFTDDLGRCIIVIGLPYPNKTSIELKEKMKYLNETLGNNAGNEYYENLCMKAVNQCIGRSIRHIKDYAAVLLIDERYVQDRVVKKLPGWISKGLHIPESYGQIQRLLVNFFKEKIATKPDFEK